MRATQEPLSCSSPRALPPPPPWTPAHRRSAVMGSVAGPTDVALMGDVDSMLYDDSRVSEFGEAGAAVYGEERRACGGGPRGPGDASAGGTSTADDEVEAAMEVVHQVGFFFMGGYQ